MPNVAVDEVESADLERLVALVRVRRGLRVLARLAVVALVVWFIVLVSALGIAAEGSRTWTWFNDHGNRGFVIVLAVLAGVVVLALATRLTGRSARPAAQLVPMIRRVPEAVSEAGKRKQDSRLLALGSRSTRQRDPAKTRGGTWALGGVLLFLVVLVAISAPQIEPGYRASHGYGGPVVTIGRDTTVTKKASSDSCDYPGGDYYVSTSRGEALVESDCERPKDGSRYLVAYVGTGLHAVPLGSKHWVTNLVAAIVAFLLALMTSFFLARRLRARTPDPQVEPLVNTIDRVAKGMRVTVRPVPRKHPARAGAATALTVRTGCDAGEVVAALRRRTMLVAGAIAAFLVVVGLAVAYG